MKQKLKRLWCNVFGCRYDTSLLCCPRCDEEYYSVADTYSSEERWYL